MFKHLHLYTVHKRPAAKVEDTLFIREGFNIWAFFLSGFWTLYHRLWLVTAGLVAFHIVLGVLEKDHGIISSGTALAIQLGMNLFVGFHANDWWRASLAKRGYETVGIVASDSELRAELRYFEQTIQSTT